MGGDFRFSNSFSPWQGEETKTVAEVLPGQCFVILATLPDCRPMVGKAPEKTKKLVPRRQ